MLSCGEHSEFAMLRLSACVENAQRKGLGPPGRHVLHQNSEIDSVQHISIKVLLHNGPPKSFLQDEESESCNEMLQILEMYLSKMLSSCLLIDSCNALGKVSETDPMPPHPDLAAVPQTTNHMKQSPVPKDIKVSSNSLSASLVSVLATTT